MTEKLNIVQSTTEPDKRNIWLKDNELKKFGAKGWSTIGGGGGGTSTDKDALYIYVDFDNFNITFNNKVYIPTIEVTDRVTLSITDKELYNILYNFLINTYRLVYIKSLPTNEKYGWYMCVCAMADKTFISLRFTDGVDMITILVNNE